MTPNPDDFVLFRKRGAMTNGARVKVKTTATGSDQVYAGREGIVVDFDASLGWTSPRALLAPDKFICVHLVPRTGLERRRGSPVVLLDANSLQVL